MRMVFCGDRRRGMVLVWALLLIGALMLVAVTFLSVGTSARQRASRQSEEITTDELAEAAQAEILAKLAEAFQVEMGVTRRGHVAASPGLLEVLRYDVPLNRGQHTGAAAFTGTVASPAFFSQPFAAQYDGMPANPRWIPLFSWTRFAPRLKHLKVAGGAAGRENPHYNPALAYNINTARNPFTPGRFLLSGVDAGSEVLVREKRDGAFALSGAEQAYQVEGRLTAAARPVWVQWVPVREDPTRPEGPENPVIGRYAYWVDVENSKLRVDLPSRAIRLHPQFARVLGDADAAEGGAEWMAQSGQSSVLAARRLQEGALAPRDHEPHFGANREPLRRDGQPGYGFAAGAAAAAREAWLGWQGGVEPLALGGGWIDWDFFEVPKPRGETGLTISQRLAALKMDWAGERQRPLHPWALQAEAGDAGDAVDALLAQAATGGFTFYGHEEDLDPLGLAKIDIAAFQREVTGNRGSMVSVGAIEGSAIWSRLQLPDYHWVYVPGGWASQGQRRSYVQGIQHFLSQSGSVNGMEGMASGLALQSLVNLAEACQPDEVPPLIDEARGLVGARSMPYVAEVLTRARSALHDLPALHLNNPNMLLQTDAGGRFNYTHNGLPLHHYATHVIVEVALGLVNPNPFETEIFDGQIELDYEWHNLRTVQFPDARPVRGPQTAAVRGRYTVLPEPDKDPKGALVEGHAVFFRLGKIPASELTQHTTLRIKGWRILRNGQVWHKVPVRAPGGRANPLPFWEMAKIGVNAGSRQDGRSFVAFQDQGARAVGWFGLDSLQALIPDTLFVRHWPAANEPMNDELRGAVTRWASGLGQRAALVERIVSIDPVLGHRTLDVGVAGISGSGHFYGVLGHTWRRVRQLGGVPVPIAGRDQPQVKAVGGWSQQTQAAGEVIATGSVLQPQGDRLGLGPFQLSSTQWVTTLGAQLLRGEYLTHAYEEAGAGGGVKQPEDIGFLTQLYLSPQLAGPLPQGRLDLEKFAKDHFKEIPSDRERRLPYVEIETNRVVPNPGGDWIKTSDGKKGLRSILCSAPAKRFFNTVGEIGFCHSGVIQTPICVGPDEGQSSFQFNSPRNGPPMRLLLDLFKPPHAEADGGQRRHAWNINTRIAHDDYMALREGGDALQSPKGAVSPSAFPAHAVWLPVAQGFSRRMEGSEAFRGREAKHIIEKDPGHLLDRHLSPHPRLPRPWDMWVQFVGGDISPARSGESLLWGVGNTAAQYFGPSLMTWEPGLGVGEDPQPWVDFQSDPPSFGRLLALGVDGRVDNLEKDAAGKNKPGREGQLKGRFASDQNLAALDPNLDFYLPAHFTPRFGMLPMRHFVSDLAIDFHRENHESNWMQLKTALNPGISSEPLPSAEEEQEQERAKSMDGASFPGGFHRSGVYYHAPMALFTNQAGVSVNAMTAVIVVQSLRDKGNARDGVPQSGPGFIDPDDRVLAERWLRVILLKDPNTQQWNIAATQAANR